MSSPTKKCSASNISSEGSSDSSNHEFSDYSSAAAVTLPSAWEGKVAAATAQAAAAVTLPSAWEGKSLRLNHFALLVTINK